MKTWNRIVLEGRKLLPAAIAVAALLTSAGKTLADHGSDGGGDEQDGDRDRRPPAPLPIKLVRGYKQINLVSDLAGQAANTDTNLVNPWGLVIGPRGNLIVADNHSGLATLYDGEGNSISMPAQVDENPTGAIMNRSPRDFMIVVGTNMYPSRLLFATESGQILAWNPMVDPSNAVVVVDNSASNAVYKGLTIGGTHESSLLYAADFHNGKVDMFDSTFHSIGSFTDTGVDPGFAPFNVRSIEGRLYVTFAKQLGPDNEDDEAGPGNGFVDVFDFGGHLVKRLAMGGTLNSPWGLAVAPGEFGRFSRALLVGNFGDGRINAFSPRTGIFLGQLQDTHGLAIQIDGLWSLEFGRGFDHNRDGDRDEGDEGDTVLYFTAGPGGESHGLLGVIEPVRTLHHSRD